MNVKGTMEYSKMLGLELVFVHLAYFLKDGSITSDDQKGSVLSINKGDDRQVGR